MTWNQRLQEALLGAVVSGGMTFAGALMASVDTRVLIGLSLTAAFGAFANGMGIAPKVANWRNRQKDDLPVD